VKGWLPLILTIIALIFNIGWSFGKLNSVADAVDRMPSTLVETYVRKDVNEEQMRGLKEQLNEIKIALAGLQKGVTPSVKAQTFDGSDYPPRRFDK